MRQKPERAAGAFQPGVGRRRAARRPPMPRTCADFSGGSTYVVGHRLPVLLHIVVVGRLLLGAAALAVGQAHCDALRRSPAASAASQAAAASARMPDRFLVDVPAVVVAAPGVTVLSGGVRIGSSAPAAQQPRRRPLARLPARPRQQRPAPPRPARPGRAPSVQQRPQRRPRPPAAAADDAAAAAADARRRPPTDCAAADATDWDEEAAAAADDDAAAADDDDAAAAADDR